MLSMRSIHLHVHVVMMRVMQGNIQHVQHGIPLKTCITLQKVGMLQGVSRNLSPGLYVFCMFVSLVGVGKLQRLYVVSVVHSIKQCFVFTGGRRYLLYWPAW